MAEQEREGATEGQAQTPAEPPAEGHLPDQHAGAKAERPARA